MQCPVEALCVAFERSPAQGTHFRANATTAEWKRDRVWARANLVAMRLGRVVAHTDLDPELALPDLDPGDYAADLGEITVAQVLRRLWRIAGPIRSMTELLEAAGSSSSSRTSTTARSTRSPYAPPRITRTWCTSTPHYRRTGCA
ncbi:hypothetical protein [Tsukamurella pulmonis]|uniref:hypothetical protein n=1 Tax=Tsukamurella pulmonis TaxID=47312 RepID=UPI001FD05049|nr:hypothetical protein [Tsukamurella pulmonis]